MNHPSQYVNVVERVDAVGLFVFFVLVVMSIATWYLIVMKARYYRRMKGQASAFQATFWQARDMTSVARYLDTHGAGDPFSHIARDGLLAIAQYKDRLGHRLIESGSADEFLTRALRRAIEQDTARLEYGHTVLASVASSAPFVGLFGTVWGIYHALQAISLSGMGTIDKVAGPVGEALIMTALGLAVAIPAVLAYNVFTRINRLTLTELDGFAHDLFAFMSTGSRVASGETASTSAAVVSLSTRGA
ncbi:MAG: hypothetical protein RLZZ344_1142 [Pseudomonadota bacterium]|jgi:biopolymer transport protein ExbB